MPKRRPKYGERTLRIQAEIPASLKEWLEALIVADTQVRPGRCLNLTEALIAALRTSQQHPDDTARHIAQL
jgi:hypothetical protein